MKRHGILVYFDAVWGPEYGIKGTHIGRAEGLWLPQKIIFTGDSKKDVELSRGDPDLIITVGRSGNKKGMLTKEDLIHSGATHVITSFQELPEIIDLYR